MQGLQGLQGLIQSSSYWFFDYFHPPEIIPRAREGPNQTLQTLQTLHFCTTGLKK
jgi:hypothetical protein